MASNSTAVTSINLTSRPTKLAEGKVRDLYDVDSSTLLFVTTDRISAYDKKMANGIPYKGFVLTQLSVHWFNILPSLVPGLKTHFISTAVPASLGLTPEETAVLKGRSMQVRRLTIFPIEAIVRGYVTGSAWKEYKAKGTVHGIKIAEGLKQCAAIPGGPIYTPSTKAPAGQHDENIHPDQVASIVPGGAETAAKIEKLALAVFTAGSRYALERGIIIADTKFEFGLDETTGDIVLVDEVLTPDSSRMWARDAYEEGRDQDSFDKQILRNWLVSKGLDKDDGEGNKQVTVSEEIVQATSGRYREVFERLTGKGIQEALEG